MLARLAARRMGSLRQPLARQSVRKSTDLYACPEGTIVEDVALIAVNVLGFYALLKDTAVFIGADGSTAHDYKGEPNKPKLFSGFQFPGI